MRISWNNKICELCDAYLNRLKNGLKDLSGMTGDVLNLLKVFFDNNRHEFNQKLVDFIKNNGIQDIAELFEGDLKPMAEYLLGEEDADLLRRYMKISASCPYTSGWMRRSQRSRNAVLHAGKVNAVLIEFLTVRAIGFPTAGVLRGGRDPEEIKELGDALNCECWLAAKIDAGDRECIDYLKEAMTSENNFNRMNLWHFRAIIRSGNPELLELEGKLLLAARLQEGLRQAIVETMDEGQPQCFIHLLKVIRDNNLQRFAAVKRGLAVTTGLGEQDAPERITDKFVNLLWEYLTQPDKAQTAVHSNDAMEVYLGLWAIGFFDVENISGPIEELIKSAPAYRVEAAMLMLGCVQYPALERRLASMALHLRKSEHGIMAGVMPLYISNNEFYINCFGKQENFPPLDKFFGTREEAVNDLNLLADICDSIGKKEVFNPYVFPWFGIELTQSEVATKIGKIAIMLDEPEITDRALEYTGFMESYSRAGYLRALLREPQTRKEIEFAVSSMADRGSEAREVAGEIVASLHKGGKLLPGDYQALEAHLRLKAAGMRVAIIEILGSLADEEAAASVRRLLADKSVDRRLAGLDIIKNWHTKGERKELALSLLPAIEAIPRPTAKEKVLIDALTDASNADSTTYSAANGFGLYDPEGSIQIDIDSPSQPFDVASALTFPATSGVKSLVKRLMNNPTDGATSLICKIMNVIEANADYEFTDAFGDKKLFGNNIRTFSYSGGIKELALPEVWKEFYEQEIGNPENILRLYVATLEYNRQAKPFYPILKKLLGKGFAPDVLNRVKDETYFNSACDAVKYLFAEYGNDEKVLQTATDILAYVAQKIAPEDVVRKYKRHSGYWCDEENHPVYSVEPLCLLINQLCQHTDRCPDKLFARSFAVRYDLYRKSGFLNEGCPIRPMEYLRAWKLGLIKDNDVWREMMARPNSGQVVDVLTEHLPGVIRRSYRRKNERELTQEERRLVNTAVDRILDIELKRGDSPTEVSPLAEELKSITGIDYFIRILVGLGKDKPSANRYSYNSNTSKRSMFSSLLRVSMPTAADTPDELKKRAKEAGISDERLVEAAMYSSRWLEIVEEAIGWKGLTCAAYYFLAHTGESLNDRDKSYIARYTSIDPEDFADGAFDPAWFREVYSTLGKKRFEVVYEAAKYISEGNRHTRARKLSDASLGCLKAKAVKKEITEKRNKDLVVAYGLIPLGRNRQADLRERYDFLNRFLKESRQFGAQRQASEGRAVKLALDNLARTAGYGDATRMTWTMEANLVKEVAEYLSPKEIDGVSAYVSLGADLPEIVIESKGKRLQSIPARLKKDKHIEKMREVYRSLKEQHIRGRALLEQAMVESSEFTGDEIAQLHDNPVIWGMFSRLVLIQGNDILGFPGDDGQSLVTARGESVPLQSDDRLRIAHPYDFYATGQWSEYQSSLFERRWRQPFKQVFRELYVPTQEEKETGRSMRYSGNQIMPARAAGVLKKRQWTVDNENGLHKVCYHGDVTAVMYAMADWFSPADIESPTLEYVAFYERRSFKEKKISEVLPIVFSEIMRDVDLAVSVAHAGGVDPEASHSTVEMRRVIIEHAMPMFGVSNVNVSGNFAKVSGTLGNYNIHLGSGVIHKEGGAQIAVLPVHSQSRGRIFLPFLDEDPKTAEIISKILLFAEDTKIKDPTILSQL